jgi:hypothetical protein
MTDLSRLDRDHSRRRAAVAELRKVNQVFGTLKLNLPSNAPDDCKPLAHPYFWGAWICQG